LNVVELSEAAAADLDDIRDASEAGWGQAQRDRYMDGFTAVFRNIAAMPGLGQPVDFAEPDLRRTSHGSHLIFYRLEGEQITISRILHMNMDAPRHRGSWS